MINKEIKKNIDDSVYMVYSVYDKTAEGFGPLFIQKSDALAIRMFGNIMTGQSAMCMEDYDLVKVGSWNSVSGQIYNLESEVLKNGVDFKKEN
jgi:hypothetical protein